MIHIMQGMLNMEIRIKPLKLIEALKPLSIPDRGKYISKSIFDIVQGGKNYDWIVKERGPKKKVKNKPYSDTFLQFWDEYPRKEDKRKAFEVWDEIENTSLDLLGVVLAALKWQKVLWQGSDKKWIKKPLNYLKDAAYEDEDPNGGKGRESFIDLDGIRRYR